MVLRRLYLNIIAAVVVCFQLSCTGRLNAQSVSDVNATAQTKALCQNLHAIAKTQTLFGHQDDLAYGVKWRYKPGMSDVKAVSGEYPAIFGWDLGGLELGKEKNLDGVPFSKMRKYIIYGYNMGSVITISWHLRNPSTGGNSWDTSGNAVASILTGGAKHNLYVSWLDKVADFFTSLKGENGEAIPILFRPFHEFTGNWFWWCENFCTPDEFKKLWRFTVHYLRNEKSLHNLIMVYCPTDIYSKKHFDERYPGDDVVDVIGMDAYQHHSDKTAYISKVRKSLKILDSVTKERNKILAFTETGYEAIPDKYWWTNTLLPAMKGFPIAWVLVWRNHGYMKSTQKMHYFAPYPGQVSAGDFKTLYNTERMLFQQDIKKRNIYSSER